MIIRSSRIRNSSTQDLLLSTQTCNRERSMKPPLLGLSKPQVVRATYRVPNVINIHVRDARLNTHFPAWASTFRRSSLVLRGGKDTISGITDSRTSFSHLHIKLGCQKRFYETRPDWRPVGEPGIDTAATEFTTSQPYRVSHLKRFLV